ncbi:MAG TPA: hypothetical protein VGA42_10360, partial [Gemmatimonadales bacterium]
TAQAAELAINPATDTALAGGTLTVTRFTVAAGRTVTVNGDLILNVDATVQIDGTLQGNCVAITLDAQQTVTVTGTINSNCTNPAVDDKKLTIIGRGGYTFAGATILSSGDLEVTNDPTLTDLDFPGAPAFRAPRARAAANPVCIVNTASYAPPTMPVDKTRAPDGAPGGRNGGDGKDGKTYTLRCRGDMALGPNVSITGQHGGNGGKGEDTDDADLTVTAGDGGEGGKIRAEATGEMVVRGPNVQMTSGNGGNGGAATATATENDAGAKAPSATSRGGDGGEPGLAAIVGQQGLDIDEIKFVIGNGGAGGDATATGADGADGTATKAAQHGGDADAEAGDGGDTPSSKLKRSGNIIGPNVVEVTGANGGAGSMATSDAGDGGDATDMMFPDGGDGGDNRTIAGDGGDSELRDLVGNLVGADGNGGTASAKDGNGGNGWNDCGNPVKPGGDGGEGGSLTETVGVGGGGMNKGTDGDAKYENVGNGGDGGDGEDPGTKGGAGGKSVTGNEIPMGTNFDPGEDGSPCPIKVTGNTSISFMHIVGQSPCPQFLGTFAIENQTDEAITITFMKPSPIDIVGPSTIPPGGTAVYSVFFNCSQAASFTGEIIITATAGTRTQEVTIPVDGQIKAQFVTLAQALGPFAAGTKIPLTAITGGVVASPDVCLTDHLHASSPSGIIISSGSMTFGPFPDPNPSACGYGAVTTEVIPAT